jgi:hypothetical protein
VVGGPGLAPELAAPALERQADGTFPTVVLSYREARTIRVRGPVTGRAYSFAGSGAVERVDIRDAAVLVRNRAFSRFAPA